MKQYITTDQLNEYLELVIENGNANLNFKRQRNLNRCVGIKSERDYPPKHLITIGTMIEILYELDFNIEISVLHQTTVTISRCGLEEPMSFQRWELCDALWEAIKEFL